MSAYEDSQARIIDQRIKAAQHVTRAMGTMQSRDSTGIGGSALFDGSTVAMPVKVQGHVHALPDDRVMLEKYGTEWIVVGAFAARGLGEASSGQFATAVGNTNTSAAYIDVPIADTMPFTKAYDLTFVLLRITASCYMTAVPGQIRFGIRVTNNESASIYDQDIFLEALNFNTANKHEHSTGSTRVLGMPRGSYTMTARWQRSGGAGTGTMDTNNQVTMEADERYPSTWP